MKRNVKRRSSCRGFTAMALVFAFIMALALPFFPAYAEDNGAVGMDVSDFSTVDIYGNKVNGDIFKSRDITVIHYFKPDYNVCIVEMGYMQTAHESFSESEAGVYGLLEASSSPELCANIMDAYAFNYPCLMLDGVLSGMTGVYPMVPQTFFVDSNGIVVEHFAGIFENYEQLEEIISSRVGQPPAPQYELGDVNMDGSVDIDDTVLLIRGILGIETTDGVRLLGDMDANGEIQINDLIILMRKVLGII